ncbi:hypothetical protein [Lactobacillus selangorensis]|nr:hypothetical protein [Lactobacillus selangorensis]
MKKYWVFVLGVLLAFGLTGCASQKTAKTALSSKDAFTANQYGMATITGKTNPNYIIQADGTQKTTADSKGKFTFQYILVGSSKKKLTLSAIKSVTSKSTKKSKTIYVEPNAKTKQQAESSRAASESEKAVSKHDESALADNYTAFQTELTDTISGSDGTLKDIKVAAIKDNVPNSVTFILDDSIYTASKSDQDMVARSSYSAVKRLSNKYGYDMPIVYIKDESGDTIAKTNFMHTKMNLKD